MTDKRGPDWHTGAGSDRVDGRGVASSDSAQPRPETHHSTPESPGAEPSVRPGRTMGAAGRQSSCGDRKCTFTTGGFPSLSLAHAMSAGDQSEHHSIWGDSPTHTPGRVGLRPEPPAAPPAAPADRGVRRRLATGRLRADCAVGSGEWAEPPHSPWTLHPRGAKRGHFCPLTPLGSTPGRWPAGGPGPPAGGPAPRGH